LLGLFVLRLHQGQFFNSFIPDEKAAALREQTMNGIARFFLARLIIQAAFLVFGMIVVLFCQLIDVKIERHGNKTYFVRKSANSIPPWVSVVAFGAVTGSAFLAFRLFSRGKKPAVPLTAAEAQTQAFPSQIRKQKDRDIDRALAIKPRPPTKKDSA
jgi:hypothetical protein